MIGGSARARRYENFLTRMDLFVAHVSIVLTFGLNQDKKTSKKSKAEPEIPPPPPIAEIEEPKAGDDDWMNSWTTGAVTHLISGMAKS